MLHPPSDDIWLGLSSEPLVPDDARTFVTTVATGGQVVFTGTVRDSAEGRTDVTALEYEAYDEQVAPAMGSIADEMRRRWPDVRRVALLHRTGRLALTDVAVVVAVGAGHREAAFEAARFGIDALKASVPIWKKEIWPGGEDWGTNASPIESLSRPGATS